MSEEYTLRYAHPQHKLKIARFPKGNDLRPQKMAKPIVSMKKDDKFQTGSGLVIEDAKGENAFEGQSEKGLQSSYVLFIMKGEEFQVMPVSEWYNFTTRPKAVNQLSTIEEVDREMVKTEKRHDHWGANKSIHKLKADSGKATTSEYEKSQMEKEVGLASDSDFEDDNDENILRPGAQKKKKIKTEKEKKSKKKSKGSGSESADSDGESSQSDMLDEMPDVGKTDFSDDEPLVSEDDEVYSDDDKNEEESEGEEESDESEDDAKPEEEKKESPNNFTIKDEPMEDEEERKEVKNTQLAATTGTASSTKTKKRAATETEGQSGTAKKVKVEKKGAKSVTEAEIRKIIHQSSVKLTLKTLLQKIGTLKKDQKIKFAEIAKRILTVNNADKTVSLKPGV